MEPQKINQRCVTLKRTFAQELRMARQALGLRRHEVAERAGLSEQAVIFLKQGRRYPSLDSALRLAIVTGMDLGGIVEGLLVGTVRPDDGCGRAVGTVAFLTRQGQCTDFAA